MGIGLALSGGGAKGIAHIGVIKALEDNGIKIDYISGCSSGSIIAGLYASGYTPNEMLNIVLNNSKNLIDYDGKIGFKLVNTMFTKKLSIKGFVKGNKLEKTLRYYLKQKGVEDISDVKMPLAIPAVNLNTGEIVYFENHINDTEDFCASDTKTCDEIEPEGLITAYGDKHFDDFPTCLKYGDLADIVRASCSFPGVFIPKTIEGVEYIDGGVRVNTPVSVLKRMGADKVIAVTFNCNNKYNFGIKNIIGISEQSFNLLSHNSNISEQNIADVNVRLCIDNVSLLDFSKSQVLVTRGYNIIARNISKIKEMLDM